MDGIPVQGGDATGLCVEEILCKESAPQLSTLRFRDPEKFVAGGIHIDLTLWEVILQQHPERDMILSWLREGVNVLDFQEHFSGLFKGVRYNSEFPPSKVWPNHASCKKFSQFVSDSILKRVAQGAVAVWGRVNVDEPPFLVLPLTVEPTKPRLCLDARFLNLWMRDCPFTLDKLIDVPRYVYMNSYITKCDDKSGYDHVLLQESSQRFFGFEWNGWWFVSRTLPFGWKESPFVYHTVGLSVSSYFRSLGIPCSLYIDDRLNGELLTPKGPWAKPWLERSDSYRLAAATTTIFIVASVLIRLGYTIGIAKSVFQPTKTLEYLGFIVDTSKQAFLIPERKVTSFGKLREGILGRKDSVDVKSLQRFQGKCISLAVAVPVAKLYIRNISSAIAAAKADSQVKLTNSFCQEILYWRFLDSWSGFLPWRHEKHCRLSMSTDASGFGWGCVRHETSGDVVIADYWKAEETTLNISTKEMLAISYALEACPEAVRDCRVDICVDSQVAIDAFRGEGSRNSLELTNATKKLYQTVFSRNLQLELSHISSGDNEADGPSRRLSCMDAMLTPKIWLQVQKAFGGKEGHSFDLMALDSNAQVDWHGNHLPHFTPWSTPMSKGVNLFAQDLSDGSLDMRNPYVFPPFCLVGAVLKFSAPVPDPIYYDCTRLHA